MIRTKRQRMVIVGRSAGFTFLEVVIAFSLFAVALVGFLEILNTAMNTSYRAQNEIIATNLARGLMSEIIAKRFEESPTMKTIGPEGNETGRSDYDDVDDFHGYSEAPPITMSGHRMDGQTIGNETIFKVI